MIKKVAVASITMLYASIANAAWDYQEVTDPMTDVRRGIAIAKGEGATLVVKCDKSGPGSLYIHIISANYLGEGRNRYRQVKYRINGGVPTDVTASHDGRDALVSDLTPGTPGGKFLEEIGSGSKLVLQLMSYDYRLYDSLFDISGAGPVIAKAAAACRDSEHIPA